MSPDPIEPAGSSRALGRRRFLVTLGGAAAWSALRPLEAWARRAGPPLALQPWSLPAQPPADPAELVRTLIGAAVLAPSHWNAQPWRMEFDGATLRLLADPRRALPVLDPGRTATMIGLGAALENLLIACRAYGLRPTVTYFPGGEKGPVVAQVTWTHGEARRDLDLFAAIPERRTNRRGYDGRGLFMQNRAALGALIPGDLRLHWLDDREAIGRAADLAHDATRIQVFDRRAQAERHTWMRFGDDEARERGDGVTVDALEIGGPARWFAGRYFSPGSRLRGLGAGSAAKQAREQVRSAGALALITAAGRGETIGLAAGQAYERFALRATRLGIAHQPLHAPIEVPGARTDLLRLFGAIGEQPLLFLRLGHARRPGPSVRRGVALVASFRNT